MYIKNTDWVYACMHISVAIPSRGGGGVGGEGGRRKERKWHRTLYEYVWEKSCGREVVRRKREENSSGALLQIHKLQKVAAHGLDKTKEKGSVYSTCQDNPS